MARKLTGFVPQHVAHPLTKCAVYECTEKRVETDELVRRYCTNHAAQYDLDAMQAEPKILPLTQS